MHARQQGHQRATIWPQHVQLCHKLQQGASTSLPATHSIGFRMHTLHACDTWARIGPATTFNNPVKHPVKGAKKLIYTQASILVAP